MFKVKNFASLNFHGKREITPDKYNIFLSIIYFI